MCALRGNLTIISGKSGCGHSSAYADLTESAQSPTIPAMHQDPWEPPDGSYPADRKPDSAASDDDPPAEGSVARIPPPLLNWHVVEIDGEATLIEETEASDDTLESVVVSSPARTPEDAAPRDEAHAGGNIRDHYDEVVVAGMQVRRVSVLPGEAAEFEVSVANHGRWSALFEISIEGWIDEAWTPDMPRRVQLEPGTRQTVQLLIQPPRQPECHAGNHDLVVVVRATRYPGHVTRLGATLVLERFAALKLGVPQPPELDLSWFVPAGTLRLPVTNQSNYPATIHLQGMDRARHCDFTFYTDGSGVDDGLMGTAHLTLQPGQTVGVPVEIRTRQRPLLGMVPRVVPFRLVARMDTEPPLRRAMDGELAVAALIGPWQMAVAAVLGVLALFGTGLAGLALLVALRSTSPSNAAPPVAATAVPAAPVVAFVIQMEQPMPTRAAVAPSVEFPVQVAPQGLPRSGPNSGPNHDASAPPLIPVVSADQVTAPGEPTPVGQPQLRPVVVTTPAPQAQFSAPPVSVAPPESVAQPPANSDNSTLTYGNMFRQVASEFDLDWRLLAAQAYLESGFDSLALSGQGDMGLMQIRPGTWNDWAPTVEASDPFDSYSNVLVGAAYLNYLREQLSARGLPQQEWMLVAYNWGPEKVYSHFDAGGTWESLDPERRQYAEDILRIAASIPPS